MKTKILMIIFILAVGIILECKTTPLSTDHFKGPSILLDDKQIYVWDQILRKIVIYKRDNFQKVAEFGRRGEGPGEFIGIEKVILSNNYIYVPSYPKLCVFSKTGKLIKEKKGPVEAGGYIPFGNNFIGISYPVSNPTNDKFTTQYSLYDGNLKKKKDIFLTEIKKYAMNNGNKYNVLWIRDCSDAVAYKDRLYIGTTGKGFYFAVFNLDGNLLYEIKKDEEKRRITHSEKQNILAGIKKNLGEIGWNEYKSRFEIIFPEYYPSYKTFFIDDDKIYVFRFPLGEKYEISILDLKGNTLKRNLKPVEELGRVEPGCFYIQGGKYYYLHENDELEAWELRELDLFP